LLFNACIFRTWLKLWRLHLQAELEFCGVTFDCRERATGRRRWFIRLSGYLLVSSLSEATHALLGAQMRSDVLGGRGVLGYDPLQPTDAKSTMKVFTSPCSTETR